MSTALAPLVVFSHGNSFPASTYRVMLDNLRQRGFRVEALEKLGHDPRYPVTNNWPYLEAQLTDFITPLAAPEPLVLVGHSLGGFLSTMVAARSPALVKGLVLLDSPLVGGWRAHLLRASKRLPGGQAFSPSAVSHKRRVHWPDLAAVQSHFESKRAFAKWDPAVLNDYVTRATHEETTPQGTQRVLSFDRAVETAIYNTLPDHLESLLKRHPLQCKAALIGGLQSRELKRAGLALSERVTQGRIAMVDGTHLFPMEHPQVTAAAVEAAILNLLA